METPNKSKVLNKSTIINIHNNNNRFTYSKSLKQIENIYKDKYITKK